MFDAAALDYHLSECWLWHDTVRPRVAVYVNTDATVKRLREEAKSPAEFWLQYYDDDKGSGGVSVVGMGRAAYKGVVTGLADVVASELQAYTDRVEKKEEEGAAKSQSSLEQDANASDIKVVSSKQRQSWLEWLGWSKTTKAPADTLQVQEPTEMDDTAHADLDPAAIDALHALASDAPLSPLKVPPVGYIPFKPIVGERCRSRMLLNVMFFYLTYDTTCELHSFI